MGLQFVPVNTRCLGMEFLSQLILAEAIERGGSKWAWTIPIILPVTDAEGPLLPQDDLFEQWRTQADLRDVRVLLAHGTADRGDIILGNGHFHEHLDRRGIEHDYLVYSGRHKWVDWRPIFPELLRFLTGDTTVTTE